MVERMNEKALDALRTVAIATLRGDHHGTGMSLYASETLKHHGQLLDGVHLAFYKTLRWPSFCSFVGKVDHRVRSHGASDCGHPVLDLSISLSDHGRRSGLDLGIIVGELQCVAMISVGLDLLVSREATSKDFRARFRSLTVMPRT